MQPGCRLLGKVQSFLRFFLLFSLRYSITRRGNIFRLSAPMYAREASFIIDAACCKAAAPMQTPLNSLFAPTKLKVAVGVSVRPCIFFGEEDLIALQVSRWRLRPEKRLMGLITERVSGALGSWRPAWFCSKTDLVTVIRQKPCCGSCKLG